MLYKVHRPTKLTKLSSESGSVADTKKNEKKMVSEAMWKATEETCICRHFLETGIVYFCMIL